MDNASPPSPLGQSGMDWMYASMTSPLLESIPLSFPVYLPKPCDILFSPSYSRPAVGCF